MLFSPMLPEAASGTLEPRHCVVPLRMMCPHAELLLGRATALDEEARTVTVETEAGHPRAAVRESRRRDRVRLARAAHPGARRPRPRVSRPRRRHPAAQPRPPPARGRRGRARPGGRRAASSRSSSSAPAMRAWRRSRELRDLVRDALRYYPTLQDAPSTLGARGRGAEDPRGDPQPARRVRRRAARRSEGSTSASRPRSSRRRSAPSMLSDGSRIPTRTLVWTAGVRPRPS